MSEYITKDAVFDLLHGQDELILFARSYKENGSVGERLCNAITRTPAADVEPVVHTNRKEKVYHIDGEDSIGVVCGNCDASQFAGLGNAKRCYNCGAHFGAHGKERER